LIRPIYLYLARRSIETTLPFPEYASTRAEILLPFT
jgi:hypothetical protein